MLKYLKKYLTLYHDFVAEMERVLDERKLRRIYV